MTIESGFTRQFIEEQILEWRKAAAYNREQWSETQAEIATLKAKLASVTEELTVANMLKRHAQEDFVRVRDERNVAQAKLDMRVFPMKRATDHVVFVYQKPEHFECRHCGETEPVPLPVNINELTARSGDFILRHAKCEKPAATGELQLLCSCEGFPFGECQLPAGHQGRHERTKLNGVKVTF